MIVEFPVFLADKRNQSYYSIVHISENCGISETSCRKVLKDLSDKGYVDISKRYLNNAQLSNLYTVNKI